jgi:hypothetical protein
MVVDLHTPAMKDAFEPRKGVAGQLDFTDLMKGATALCKLRIPCAVGIYGVASGSCHHEEQSFQVWGGPKVVRVDLFPAHEIENGWGQYIQEAIELGVLDPTPLQLREEFACEGF